MAHSHSGDAQCGSGQRPGIREPQTGQGPNDHAGGSGEVAHADGLRQPQPQGCERDQRGWVGYGSESICNTHCKGLEIGKGQRGDNGTQQQTAIGADWWELESDVGGLVDGLAHELVPGWWDCEPDIGRVATGVKNRVNQLKALGNGQVPLQAAAAWKILMERP